MLTSSRPPFIAICERYGLYDVGLLEGVVRMHVTRRQHRSQMHWFHLGALQRDLRVGSAQSNSGFTMVSVTTLPFREAEPIESPERCRLAVAHRIARRPPRTRPAENVPP